MLEALTEKLAAAVILPRVTVTQMTSDRSGKLVANQFVIATDDGLYFQSYRTVIAFMGGGKLVLDRGSWDYSVTTARYRNKFTRMNTKETRQAIADGRITLADLN